MNSEIFKYLVFGVFLIEVVIGIYLVNRYRDNVCILIKELFNIYKKDIHSNFLKIYHYTFKISFIRILVIVGLLALIPFIYLFFIPDDWTITAFLKLIVSLFELKNIILIFFTIATLIIMLLPIIHKPTRDFWIKHEYAISKSKNKLIALAFYSFCSSVYFALLYPTISNFFFALTCIITLSLYAPPYTNALDFQYNIKKTIFFIFEMQNEKNRKNKNKFAIHFSSLLLDIDMRLPTPLKIDNLEVPTNNCCNIPNKTLLRTYLPLYVADATECQRNSLKRKFEKIGTLFSEKNYTNMLLIRDEIYVFFKLIDEFVDEKNIEIQ